MKELARYKNIVVSLFIVLIVAISLRSIYSNYSLKLKKLSEEEVQIKEAKDIIFEWINLNSKLEQLRSQFLEKDTILFKKLVEEKARLAKIDLPSLRLSRIDKDSYWEVRVRLNTTCPYSNFVEFVDSLADKNIEVVTASLSGDREKVAVDAEIKGVVLK
ncbi:MAG: hypothetical protein K9L86_04020 [Candidatus Omnitrophica bacterium]|nr:hypothetical protein [Candidatus Omnitrophota bacterium]